MPLFLLGLLKSKWTWYAIAAVALLLAFVAVRAHYIDEGKKAGVEQQQQAEAKDLESLRANAQAALQATVADAQQKIAAAEARATQAAQAAQQQQALVVALASQRQQAAQTVAGLQDSQLHAYNVQQLAVRAPSDSSPGYTPAEERAISNVLTQFPLVVKQSEAQAKQIADLSDQITAVGVKVDSLTAMYNAQVQYSNVLSKAYTTLYNEMSKNTRGWKCLGLWRCQSHQLPTPAPQALIQ